MRNNDYRNREQTISKTIVPLYKQRANFLSSKYRPVEFINTGRFKAIAPFYAFFDHISCTIYYPVPIMRPFDAVTRIRSSL